MPVTSYMMISTEPAILGVSINLTHSTFKNIIKAKIAGFSIIDKKDVSIIESLLSVKGYMVKDKLAAAKINYFRSMHLHIPIPVEAVAYIETKLRNFYEVGNHALLLCDVISSYASDDFVDYWMFQTYKPLLYAGMRNGIQTYNPSTLNSM